MYGDPLARFERDVDMLSGRENVTVYRGLGASESGYPIFVVRAGSGGDCLMSFGRIHGNEQNTTPGIMSTLDYLTREEPGLLDGISYVAVPCLNPDGARLNIRRNARGVDINRDFGLESEGTGFASSEARAARRIMEEFRPLYVMDHHNCGWDRFYCLGSSNTDHLREPVEEMILRGVSDAGYGIHSTDGRKAGWCGQLVNYTSQYHCSGTITEVPGMKESGEGIDIHKVAELAALRFMTTLKKQAGVQNPNV